MYPRRWDITTMTSDKPARVMGFLKDTRPMLADTELTKAIDDDDLQTALVRIIRLHHERLELGRITGDHNLSLILVTAIDAITAP